MKSAFCITKATDHKEINDYFTQYTHFFAHRLNHIVLGAADIVFADSIDHGLKNYGSKYDYILFMQAGCRVLEDSVILDVAEQIEDDPYFLCAAHILDWTNKNEWYELHEQFVLVNIKTWKEIDCPKFGGWTEKHKRIPVIERSKENFHDDYTPLWIKDSGKRKTQRHGHPGWNFLVQGLKNGCDIINWNQTIREKRTFYYPYMDSELFWECIKNKTVDPGITNFNQQQFLQFIKHGVQDQIWLYNSEDMDIEHDDKKYDVVALPASGFKYLDVFKSGMLKENGKLIIYDFNPRALEWIKTLHQSNSFNIEQIASNFKWQKNFKQIRGYGLQKTIDYFENHENFNNCLSEFRKADITFAEVDIVQKPEPLFEELKGEAFIHISNIFATDWLVATYGLKFAEERLKWFLDTAPDNIKVTGLTPTYPSAIV